MFTVVQTRKELSADGTHKHITGVFLLDGTYKSRAEVVAGLYAGQDWRTLGTDRSNAKIRIDRCRTCGLNPYITTAPDHTTANNLDNLPVR